MSALATEDEKDAAYVQGSVALVPQQVDLSDVVNWTPEEEKKAVWKQTMVVMPLLILGFFSLQLDRGNISQALTGTLLKDVGISQDTLNNGQSLLLVMIVIFEIPSNLVLVRIGPKWWLGSQMILWGVIATAQSAMRSPAAFYVTRVLLGIFESGFIPGMIYYLSCGFTGKEQAKRVAWFYLGNICGKGSSGLIASGVLKMTTGGIPGWAWIFLIEGAISIGIGILFLVLLPRSPSDSRTLLGFSWFTERESHILATRVILDDPLKAHPHSHFTKKNVFVALSSWRMWLHAVFCISGVACSTAVNTYNAQVIKALGFTATGKANAMSSLGSWLQAPLTLAWGYAMDHTRFKGPLMILNTVIMIILDAIYYAWVKGTKKIGKWNKYAVFELIVGFGEPLFVGGLAWAVSTARTPAERSMYAAMYVMSSNSGQAIGGQMFRAADSPKYIKGFTACIVLYCFALLVAVGLTIQYYLSNRNSWGHAGKEAVERIHGEGSHDQDEAEVRKVFQYPT